MDNALVKERQTRRVLSKLKLLLTKTDREEAQQMKHPFIQESMEAIQVNMV